MSAGVARGAEVRLVTLGKRFGNVVAVDDVSLDVQRGEFLTLLGPSGSGKTTTLMMIAGLVLPTTGGIYLDERDVSLLPPNRRNIGVVFQSYALFPHMAVFDNVAFPLRMRNVPKSEIRERVEAVLRLVRLEGLGTRYQTQLSGGQQQRVALARALVFAPALLLMDEPLGALDKKLREHMQLEIKHLQETLGLTVIYVTHDQQEALTMSDRIAVMNHGRVEQVGHPDDLYERPASKFVADFIGESNFLPGVVEAVDGSGVRVRSTGGLAIVASVPARMGVGAAVHVLVRPERVQVARDRLDLANSFEGVLREAIYVGDILRYTVDVIGETLVSKKPNLGGGLIFRRGDKVEVGWSAADSLLMAES
jgi:spermidine/putrescine ABC transporter ATP-binding subunit